MKVNLLFLFLICVALFLQSCAPARPTRLSAVVSSDQKIGYEETLISRKKHFVSLSPYEELDMAMDKTLFMLGIQSGGDTSFEIGCDNVSVYFQDSGMTRSPIRVEVQTDQEFLSDLREEQHSKENRHIRKGLEGVYRDLASPNTSQEELIDELDDLEMDIESMRTRNQMLRDALPDTILQARTIVPGGAYSGIVVCDTRKLDEKMEGRFQVTVQVDGEQHIFSFKRLLNE